MTYLHDVWNGVEQLHQLRVPVVCHAALAPEVMVVGRDELAEGHTALRAVLEQLHHVPAELREMLSQQWGAAQPPELCNRRAGDNQYKQRHQASKLEK